MLDNWCIPKGGNVGVTLLDCQSISWRKLSKERGAVRVGKKIWVLPWGMGYIES